MLLSNRCRTFLKFCLHYEYIPAVKLSIVLFSSQFSARTTEFGHYSLSISDGKFSRVVFCFPRIANRESTGARGENWRDNISFFFLYT